MPPTGRSAGDDVLHASLVVPGPSRSHECGKCLLDAGSDDAGGLQAILVHGVGRHEVGVVDHEAADLAVHTFVDLEGAIGRVERLDRRGLAVGLCAQRRQALCEASRRFGELGFPEVETLSLGEVGLLRGARIIDGVQHLLAQRVE